MHAHFFPQQSQERIELNDMTDHIGQTDDSDQPRRMYVREQFTHENTVRGNVADHSDGMIRRWVFIFIRLTNVLKFSVK